MLKDRKGSHLGNVRLALWALASVVALWSFSGVAMAALLEGKEGRVALVEGNSDYQHTARLANPGNDATAMAEALREMKFEVILGIDLDSSSFVEKLKEFESATEGASAALFFYAGSASQYQGVNYLAPIDAAKVDHALDYKYHHIELRDVMDSMRSETKLVFLDACFDSLLDERFRTRRETRETGSASNLRGIAHVNLQTEGWYIAYAAQPGRVVNDGPPGGNSPFTAALLKHIRTPMLEVGKLMARVRRTVLRETNLKQQPWDTSSLVDPFVFFQDKVVPSHRRLIDNPLGG